MSKTKVSLGVLVVICGCFFAFFKNVFLNQDFFYCGTLEATRIVIPSRLSTKIISLKVKDGTRVAKDQVIAELDSVELKILYKKAKSEYERGLKLYKGNQLPLSKLEPLEFEKELVGLKVSWCNITSPIDGIILTKYREEGEFVNPGTGIFAIANLKEIWTHFYVEQEKIYSLKIGDPIDGILPEIKGRVFKGKIIKINSEPEFTPKNVQTRSERVRLVYGVKVAFENEDEVLKPGMIIETKLNDKN